MEGKQFFLQEQKLEYFKLPMNYSDIAGLLLTVLVTLHCLLGLTMVDLQELRTISALAILLLVVKIYDWLRLFETTAFYVQLLWATLTKIVPFMILFVVALLLFGLPLAMLNQNRLYYNDDDQIIKELLFGWLYDVVYN